MDYRLYTLSALCIWQNSITATPMEMRLHVDRVCSDYLQNSQRATSQLLECLRHFQQGSAYSIKSTLIRLINELYAADLMLLNELNSITQKHDGSPLVPQLFPKNLTADAKKLYHRAELLIMNALKKL